MLPSRYQKKPKKPGKQPTNGPPNSDDRIYTIFTESILDNDYNTSIIDAEKKGSTLEELQVDLCAQEPRTNARLEKLRILKARRAAKDTTPKGGGSDSTPRTPKGEGGGARKGEGPKDGPTPGQKKA